MSEWYETTVIFFTNVLPARNSRARTQIEDTNVTKSVRLNEYRMSLVTISS